MKTLGKTLRLRGSRWGPAGSSGCEVGSWWQVLRTILVALLLVGGSAALAGQAYAVDPGPADAFRCEDQYFGLAGVYTTPPEPFMYASVNVPSSEGPCGSPAYLYVDTPVYVGAVDGVEVTFAKGLAREYTLTASGTVTLGDGSEVAVLGTWTSDARPTLSHTTDRSIAPGCLVNSTTWEWDTGTATLTIGATEYTSFANMVFAKNNYSGVCNRGLEKAQPGS